MANSLQSGFDERREGKLLDGVPGAVTIHISPISKRDLEIYYHQASKTGGAEITYRGHKDDLSTAGCLKFAIGSYDDFHDDGYGGSWVLSGKWGPGKRGFIEVSYYACDPAFAASLPGARALFPEAIAQM